MHHFAVSEEEENSIVKVNEWFRAEEEYIHAQNIAEQQRSKSNLITRLFGAENLTTHGLNKDVTNPKKLNSPRFIAKSRALRHVSPMHGKVQSGSEPKFDCLAIKESEHAASESALSTLLNLHLSWTDKPNHHDNQDSEGQSSSSMDFSRVIDAAFEELLSVVGQKKQSADQNPLAQEEAPLGSHEGGDSSELAGKHDWESKAMVASRRARCMTSQDGRGEVVIPLVYMF
eukprot:760164-Hanusia_phi.AAC.3